MSTAQIFMMPLAGTVMPEMATTDTTAAASTVSGGDIFSGLLGNMLGNQAEQNGSAVAENPEQQKQPEFTADLPKQLDALFMQEEAGAVQLAELVSAAFDNYQQPDAQNDLVQGAEQSQGNAVKASTPQVGVLTAHVEAEAPQVEASTVQTQVTTPKVEVSTPQVAASTPQVQGSTLQTEASTPQVGVLSAHVEAEAPQVEASTVRTQVTTPKVEVSTLQVEASTPQTEASTPKVVATAPQVEASTPQTEASAPKVEVSTPKVAATVPQVEASTLQTEASTPKVEATTPKVEATTAKVEATAPKVEASTVQTQVTTPKVEATAQKAEATTAGLETTGQPVQEQQAARQGNKPATAWWGYEKPLQQVTAANDLHQSQHPAQAAKTAETQPKAVEQQVTAATAESAAAKNVTRLQTAEAAVEKSDNSNSHNLVANGSTNRLQAEAVSQPEKGAETNRQATPEQQVYKQFSDHLSRHDFKQGAERVSFSLHPENLGKLHLNFQMEQQTLRVEIVAESRIARDALLQHLDQVKESLARQNINLEKFDVSTSDGRMFQHQQPSPQRNLYGHLYERQQNGGKVVNGEGTAAADGYQSPDAVQYFAPQYESTFNYQA